MAPTTATSIRAHSSVGLITNSSSEVYSYTRHDWNENIRIAGQKILDAIGVELTFDEVFEVDITMNGEPVLRSKNGIELDFKDIFESLYYQDAEYNG